MKKSIASCLITAALFAGSAAAETTLRAFIPVSETRPEAKAFNAEFADKVAELSGGDLKVQTFYAGGLGFETKDLLRHLRKGTVDIGAVLGAYYPRDAESLSLMLVDGGITEPGKLADYRGVFADQFDKSLERWKVVNVGTLQPLVLDHSIFCKQPVTSLEQLKTRKLRVWTKHQLEAFKSLGVPAQMIPQEDLYVALQTGVVDCAIYLGELAMMMGLQEVAPYETYYLPYVSAPAGIGLSAQTWSRLTEEQQHVLREAGKHATEATTTLAVEFSKNKDASRNARKEKGIVITEGFSEADRATLVAALRNTWRSMAEDAGPESVALVDRVLSVGH